MGPANLEIVLIVGGALILPSVLERVGELAEEPAAEAPPIYGVGDGPEIGREVSFGFHFGLLFWLD